MNKNVIYFSINKNYLECLTYNLNCLKKITKNYDICCIIPQELNLQLTEIKKHCLLDVFDLYSSRFLIYKWEEFNRYDNFLYLDADAILLKSPDEIFKIIESQPDFIHGVKEKHDISCLKDPFFRFTDNKIENAIGYNSGTFGFNKKISYIFPEFVEYINLNKEKALNDQPLYNEFFNIKKNILPTLSKFVYFKDPINYYDKNNINIICKSDATIIHFLGNYGNLNYKLEKIKEELLLG